MARVTYGALVTQLRGSIGGTVFQGSAYGHTAKNTPNMTRPNTAAQDVIKRAVVRCVQRWANLLPAYRLNWNSYAAAYPQYAKFNAGSQLSGYAVFLKRNMIAEITGVLSLDNPSLIATVDSTLAPTLVLVGGDLVLTFNAVPAPSDISGFIFASPPTPSNKPIRNNQLRFLLATTYATADVSLLASYVNLYGRLPIAGEKVLLVFQNAGNNTGAVFAKQAYEVIVTI